MAHQAQLNRQDGGLVPADDGWFVVNARETRWLTGDFGAFTPFEGEQRFPGLGINIGVLQPGEPSCYYHAENEQEDFLVLGGECLLLIDGEERPLKPWDFVHCPAGTPHVLVGAGEGPCAVLAVGTRTGGDIVYPVSELAQRHRAGVEQLTENPAEAYAGHPDDRPTAYCDGWLPHV